MFDSQAITFSVAFFVLRQLLHRSFRGSGFSHHSLFFWRSNDHSLFKAALSGSALEGEIDQVDLASVLVETLLVDTN